jgi:sigma-70-like protein
MDRWIPGRRERPGPDAETPSEPRTPLRLVEGEAYTGWEAIYLDNVQRIYRLMFSKVGNRPDAEDLTAEVFLTALRPLRTSASVGEVRAYLLATAWRGSWRRCPTATGASSNCGSSGPTRSVRRHGSWESASATRRSSNIVRSGSRPRSCERIIRTTGWGGDP